MYNALVQLEKSQSSRELGSACSSTRAPLLLTQELRASSTRMSWASIVFGV